MNRIVFITGATSGIGEAAARKFAEGGDHLIINGRRRERLEALAAELTTQYKIRVFTLVFDVRERKAVEDAVSSLPAEWQNIDILLNNAGLALGRDYFDEGNVDDWDTMMQTNVNGLLYVSRAVTGFMTKRNRGHIVNMGSTAGKEVYEKGNVYCASKFAVDGITKAMRIDLLRYNIKVTSIDPGAVETEFALVRFKGDTEKAAKVYEGMTPLTPADIADTIWYCCSLPAHVCINDLVITCTQQANSIFFNKN